MRYEESKKYDKAIELNQYVVDNWPEAEHALFAQADLIKSYLALGDDPNAEAAVKKLLSEFSGNRYKPRAIHNTAWEYRKAGRYDKADQLYQYVVDNQSGNEDMMWVKTGIARLNIALGNDAAVEKTIDILITDFNDNPELATAIFILGEEYYNEAFNTKGDTNSPDARPEEYYRKALAVWERIVAELPQSESTDTAHAYYFSAVCYRKLGNQEKAVEYFQKVVDRWPEYRYAWSAQCLIGECYEKLQSSGKLSVSEAEPMIEQAYQVVIEKYPDCSLVGHACLKLGQPSFKKGRWSDAAYYFELFLQKSPDDPRGPGVLYDLGRTYEKMGELEQAEQVYRAFIEKAPPDDQRTKSIKERLKELGGQTK